MNDFDRTLDECLTQITGGASSLDECLARHPEQASQLKPLLQTAAIVERGRAVKLSPAFKARTRTQLYAHMQAHPRRRAWTFPPVWRVAVSLAVLAIAFLITGTAFAQGALPGQPLYAWKLSSEQAWRAVSPDPVAVDLSLAERRVDEITIIAAEPALKAEALNGYLETLARLESESNAANKEKISLALKSHQEKLSAAGVSVPELDHTIKPSGGNPANNNSPDAAPIVPVPSLSSPGNIPSLPPVVPTAHIPPGLQP